MPRTNETFTLGGRAFALEPPTLGQLRGIVDALDAMQGAEGGTLIERGVDVLVAGLARTEPEMTPDELLGLDATMAELNAAVAAVLRVSGLRSAEELGTGEAVPVANGALPDSLATFTAPSPPAAATIIEPSTA